MTETERLIEGVLPVDKPAGPTSHDMVARARRCLGTRRIGHTGTLDPFASGLLLLCIGRATRIAEYLSGMDKQYSAVVRLGMTTDTDDATGAVTGGKSAERVAREEVEQALRALRGDILQMPPAYSAKKVRGERAYALARQGREVELTPVRVTVRRLDLTAFAPAELGLDITCSSGTYIRAIARDLGEALGTGAHLAALRRTAVGPHRIESAVSAVAMETQPEAVRAALIPTLDAIGGLARLELSEDEVAHIRHGRAIDRDSPAAGTVALSAAGELVAIGSADGRRIQPRKVFL